MRVAVLSGLALAGLIAAPGVAAASDGADDLGVTMSVIEDERAAHEREVVHEIVLPEVTSEVREKAREAAGETTPRELGLGAERSREALERGPGEGDPARDASRP